MSEVLPHVNQTPPPRQQRFAMTDRFHTKFKVQQPLPSQLAVLAAVFYRNDHAPD